MIMLYDPQVSCQLDIVCLIYPARPRGPSWKRPRENEWFISFVYYEMNINICFTTISILLRYKRR